MASFLDLNDVRLLMKVIEHGSYTAAARATGVPKSTISQRIANLERAVGTGLLRRTSRSLSLTEAGAILLPRAQAIDRLATEAEQALLDRGENLVGTLRVTASLAVSQFALAPILPRFLATYPGVTIRLESRNRYVDIIAEGFDLAVRAHTLPLTDSTLLQRTVARTPWCLTAAPRWLEVNGIPSCPEDLASVETLYFATTAEGAIWSLSKDGQTATVALNPRMWSENMAVLRAAASEGGGVAGLPDYIVAEPLRNGELLPVLPGWTLPTSSLSTLTPPRLQSSRLTKAFSDFISQEMRRTTVAYLTSPEAVSARRPEPPTPPSA